MIRQEKLEELRVYIEELKTIRVVKKEKIDQGFLSINRLECQLNNGHTITREQIIKGGREGGASIILPITKDNNVLLIVEPRVLTKDSVGIELPAGYIELNEDPLLAAKRELEEETGYVPERMQFITKYYQDQGCSSAMNYSFLALNCERKRDQHLDKDEYIRYFECQYEEMLELVEGGFINDANSLLAIEKSKTLLKGGR